MAIRNLPWNLTLLIFSFSAYSKPLYIFNGKSIKHLVDFGTIVIAWGGGGIPAYNKEDGNLEGFDAVIDKDMTAALIGRVTKTQELYIITDVDNIYINYMKTNQTTITKTTVQKIERYLNAGHFQEGTMAPKIRASLYFLKYHGKKVVITSISNLKNAILNFSKKWQAHRTILNTKPIKQIL